MPWLSGGPVVIDPPLCCVLQMGGGKVQTRAAGVDGGIHAAGDVYGNIYVQLSCVCQIPSTTARAHQGRQKINFKDLTRDCYNTFFSAVPGIDQEQKRPFFSDSGSATSQLQGWSAVLQGMVLFRSHRQICEPGNLNRSWQERRSH